MICTIDYTLKDKKETSMSDVSDQKDSLDPRDILREKVVKDQKNNTGTDRNEYCDVLSTEDCFETSNVVRGYN